MSRFFRIIVGVMFLLWSGACTMNACDHWKTFQAISAGTIVDPRGIETAHNEAALYWGISLLMALGTLGVGGYIITKK